MRYPAMPRFFFHLKDDETICDREGQFFLDVEEARQVAIRSARDMLAEEVRRGELNLIDRILIADENGNSVLVVPSPMPCASARFPCRRCFRPNSRAPNPLPLRNEPFPSPLSPHDIGRTM